MPETPTDAPTRHFIQQIIDADIASGKWGPAGERAVVATRFPPEPNGYLHVGHAKAICLNFALAQEFGGTFYLRFDDTNPAKEEDEYVHSIIEDVRWLGVRWQGMAEPPLTPDTERVGVRFASDYFEQMHDWAVELIKKGLAYVDDQSGEQISATRGNLKNPGTRSPHAERSVDENLDLFARMVKGEFETGSRVLRAKIDMASPNMNLRDPVMYRVLRTPHHRTGDRYCVYPMYDWAHGLEDSIEGITHSICTLEFEDHRPLYDWFIDAINKDRGPGSEWGEPIHHPQQIEFARFNPAYTIMSKRYLLQLVKDGHVSGWNDPRMPTISGMRRAGHTPEAIRSYVLEAGVTKYNALVDAVRLENAARDHLNKTSPRYLAVLDPLKVTITSWPEGEVDMLPAVNNPEDPEAGTREVPFSGTLYIEQDDFMEDAPKKFFRLKPGGEVRLRYGYWITCQEVIKNDAGEVIELRCTHDPETRGGNSPPAAAEGKVRKVKGTIHWVSAEHAERVEVRLYDRLFTTEQPGKATGDFLDDLNPDSLAVVPGLVEPALAEAARTTGPGLRVQFERTGYFCTDIKSTAEKLVFNRTVTLKDSWSKQAGK